MIADDTVFYQNEIAPYLPPAVLDFHAHTWSSANWRATPWETDRPGGRYMVTQKEYPPEQLLADGAACFPDRPYLAVCFGYPTPVTDWPKDTAFVAKAARSFPTLFPLVLGGRELGLTRTDYEAVFQQTPFFGFKVFLNWLGDDYGDKRVEEMLGPAEMTLAGERGLIVLLHVPRAGRLADPIIGEGVRRLALDYPRARIVLAHCGRCYLPGEMKAALNHVRGAPNLWFDASMVMDPIVFQMIFDAFGPDRLLYATDFPVAAMKGRRVRVMDHWVDITLPGYPASAWRVQSEGIRAVFMAWEIILALRWAAEVSRLSETQHRSLYLENGLRLLQAVDDGRPFRARLTMMPPSLQNLISFPGC